MKRKWVSVKDRLPDYSHRAGNESFVSVIAYANGIVSEALYCNGSWQFLGIDNFEHVTHWMPLPKPLKDGK